MLHITIYSDFFIPARFAGITFGPFVFIKPSYKADEGLLQHELTHVKQFWHNPLFGLWYQFSKKDRLKYEAEAYKVQMKFCPVDRTELFASFLVKNYKLNITMDEARIALA
jgi:hypothetical protein